MHIYKMLFFTNKVTLIWISLREAYIKILPDSLGKKKNAFVDLVSFMMMSIS